MTIRDIGVQTSPYNISEHPQFFDTVQGIVEYEKAQYEKQIAEAVKAKEDAELANMLKQDFINNFLYGKFKVPIEMDEELQTILNSLSRVEGTWKNDKYTLRSDSEYNQDMFNQLNDWLDRAVQAGVQIREFNQAEVTKLLEAYGSVMNRVNVLKRKQSGEGFPWIAKQKKKRKKV